MAARSCGGLVGFLSQRAAQELDAELMSEKGGFAVEQLMELAGLSVAQVVHKEYPPHTHRRVLLCCGPGNNGGDGLVAARHLAHFGYSPALYYPKRTGKSLYRNLVKQLENLAVPFLDNESSSTTFSDWFGQTDVIVDAIFGFSFSGEVRAPFNEAIEALKKTKVPIVSVDIPSGWDVEEGNIGDRSFEPSVLVSLTAPKLGTKSFSGKHWLGGRFVPPELAKTYNLTIPSYPGTDQCVKILSTL